MKTVCFIGNGGTDWGDFVMDSLRQIIDRAIAKGVNKFITGGGFGVGQLAAHIVDAARKDSVSDVSLWQARAFEGCDSKWTSQQRCEWNEFVTEHVQQSFDIGSPSYAVYKVIERNHWMVNQSDAVILVWNGHKQGNTFEAYYYATKKGKPIYWINPVEEWGEWVKPNNKPPIQATLFESQTVGAQS